MREASPGSRASKKSTANPAPVGIPLSWSNDLIEDPDFNASYSMDQLVGHKVVNMYGIALDLFMIAIPSSPATADCTTSTDQPVGHKVVNMYGIALDLFMIAIPSSPATADCTTSTDQPVKFETFIPRLVAKGKEAADRTEEVRQAGRAEALQQRDEEAASAIQSTSTTKDNLHQSQDQLRFKAGSRGSFQESNPTLARIELQRCNVWTELTPGILREAFYQSMIPRVEDKGWLHWVYVTRE